MTIEELALEAYPVKYGSIVLTRSVMSLQTMIVFLLNWYYPLKQEN